MTSTRINRKKRLFASGMRLLRKCVIVKKGLLVVPPTSPGSLGDEALMGGLREALSNEQRYNTTLAVYRPTDKWDVFDSDCNIVSIGKFFSGGDGYSFARMSLRTMPCRSAIMIGADVLDGKYSSSTTLRRLELVSLLTKMGMKVTVCSFSFNNDPKPEVIDALIKLAPSVTLVARDNLSQQRLQSIIGREVTLSADLAFLLKPDANSVDAKTISLQINNHRANGFIAVGINLNHIHFENMTTAQKRQSVCSYAYAFRAMLSKAGKIFIVGLPHDIRAAEDDYELLSLLKSEIHGSPDIEMAIMPRESTAASIKYVAGTLDYVITGRMHVAIGALGQGVPVGCVVYQGKFEGLMNHFGLQGNLISPDDVCNGELLARLFNDVNDKKLESRKLIESRLTEVKKMALNNIPIELRKSSSGL